MKRRKWYVGCKGGSRIAFATATTTNIGDYAALIGPFRTKRGAQFMARYGRNNPHIRNVADAERLAKARTP